MKLQLSETHTPFFSDRLRMRLRGILQAPVTLICAGSGFGKTTAVSHFLKDSYVSGLQVKWHTCYDSVPAQTWRAICNMLSKADSSTSSALAKLEYPAPDNLSHIFMLLDRLSCEDDFILVVDNYQLSGFSEPYRLLDVLSMHGCEHLHLVFITQSMWKNRYSMTVNPWIYHMSQEDFSLCVKDIQKLFAQFGSRISLHQAETLHTVTGGWIAALTLQLAYYIERGQIGERLALSELIYQTFFASLSKEQRDFFLALSLLDTFTQQQAAMMSENEILFEECWNKVINNAFIRFNGTDYIMHSVLKDFYDQKFMSMPHDFQKQVYILAANSCLFVSNCLKGVGFLLLAGEYERILSIELTSGQLAELVRGNALGLKQMLEGLEDRFLQEQWRLLMAISIKASLIGQISLGCTAYGRLEKLSSLSISDSRLGNHIKAALSLVDSFRSYNDVAAMCYFHKKTWDYLDNPYDFYLTNDAWTFCIPSPVYMFWRKTGELQNTLKLITEGIPRYAAMAGGKGTGSPETMRAEMELLSGDTKKAFDSAWSAYYIAKNHGQDSLCFAALMILCRIAILEGDCDQFTQSMNAIEKLAFEGTEFGCVTMSGICAGFIYLLLDMDETIPSWLQDKDCYKHILYPVSVPFADIIYARLQRKQRSDCFPGIARALLEGTNKPLFELPKIYLWLELAVAYERTNCRDMALRYLKMALEHALPDQVYLPVAEYYKELLNVLGNIGNKYEQADKIRTITALGRKMDVGAAKIRRYLESRSSPLTPREKEIALLARQRLTNEEIAHQLYISPATVKNILYRVYDKLNIHGKKELNDIEF